MADHPTASWRGRCPEPVASMVEHLQRIEAHLELDTGRPDRQTDLVKALLA